jgi:hypothetical protein
MVLFCAAFFAAVSIAFGVEFAEDAGGLFFDVTAEDFVVCYLASSMLVSATVE